MKFLKKYSHIFFDLDGTLWDFEKNSKEALIELYFSIVPKSISETYGFEIFHSQYLLNNQYWWHQYSLGLATKDEVRYRRFEDTFSYFTNEYKIEARKLAEAYISLSPTKTNIFDNTHKVLTELKNNFQLHLISNGFDEVQHLKLKNCNLTDYFTTFTLSEKAGALKPQKKIFEYALNQAKAFNNDSVMIGDNMAADIHGALNFGIDAIHIDFEQIESFLKHDKFISINSLTMLLDI